MPKPMTGRPPRPAAPDPARVQHYATVMGMKPLEIVDVSDEPGGDGTLVTTKDGMINLIDKNDKYLGLYRPGMGVNDMGEPWTLDDLAREADRVSISRGVSLQAILAAEGVHVPIRAFALWQKIAGSKGLSMVDAAVQSAEAAECRRLVLASNWLHPDEAAKL